MLNRFYAITKTMPGQPWNSEFIFNRFSFYSACFTFGNNLYVFHKADLLWISVRLFVDSDPLITTVPSKDQYQSYPAPEPAGFFTE